MSKSKKNTIDPETMIKNMVLMLLDGSYFLTVLQKKIFNGLILVLSSSNKFLQKIWNLNLNILNRKKKNLNKKFEKNLIQN